MDILMQLQVTVVVDDERCAVHGLRTPVLKILYHIPTNLGKDLALLGKAIMISVGIQSKGNVSGFLFFEGTSMLLGSFEGKLLQELFAGLVAIVVIVHVVLGLGL